MVWVRVHRVTPIYNNPYLLAFYPVLQHRASFTQGSVRKHDADRVYHFAELPHCHTKDGYYTTNAKHNPTHQHTAIKKAH